jgi:uncharacterized membrane protein YgaE (UPF0421/DUF939 family)
MDGREILDKANIAQLARATNRVGVTGRQVLEHCARTAVAAVASFAAARLFRLPQAYWAPITTIVITQSGLGAALAVSWQRFTGTALGAAVGALLASYFGRNMLVFGASVFLLGLFCAVAHADRSAYRFGGVTLAIVLLAPRTEPGWRIAFHRFAEVSVGIAVALVMTVVWPENEATTKKERTQRP